MKRVVVDRFGGPEVVRVVEDDDPRPGPGEVRVRVLASGVSFTDALLRAGAYLGGPKPPFTPGYELVGVVDELGPGCSRLREGDRIGALTVWGANAERVCVPEAYAVDVPEDLDPAEVAPCVPRPVLPLPGLPGACSCASCGRAASAGPGATACWPARCLPGCHAGLSEVCHKGVDISSRAIHFVCETTRFCDKLARTNASWQALLASTSS
jgi:hypothetical protein